MLPTYLITGAAGFVGANLTYALLNNQECDVIAVDNFSQSEKFHNLVDCNISDYYDKSELLGVLKQLDGKITAILHQGACSDTMESDGRYMMANNYRYSCDLLQWANQQKIPFLYASSAAVYGSNTQFISQRQYEKPLNIYGYSKFLFDQFLRHKIANHEIDIPVIGFRYFNIYGPREAHKGRMASVAYHHFQQYQQQGYVNLFKGSGGYGNGQQCRDFIYIDDVVALNLHFLARSLAGEKFANIVNLGTGRAQSFNDLSMGMINACRIKTGKPALSLAELVAQNSIRYIDFPEALIGKYQHYTQAEISCLRNASNDQLYEFTDVAIGTAKYCDWLSQS